MINIDEISENVSAAWHYFDNNVENLSDFESLTKESYTSHKNHQQSMINYIEKYAKDEEHSDKLISRALKDSESVANLYTIVDKAYFIFLVSQFESFYKTVFELIILINYKVFLNSDQKVTYAFALQFSDNLSLLKALSEKEINELTYKSIVDQFKEIAKRYNFSFKDTTTEKYYEFDDVNTLDFKRLNEIFAARNIILHNRGMVNSRYLESCTNDKFALNEEYKIDKDYLRKTNYFIWSTGYKIYKRFLSKYNLHEPISS